MFVLITAHRMVIDVYYSVSVEIQALNNFSNFIDRSAFITGDMNKPNEITILLFGNQAK
ncbi:hypothetical protein D3C80_1731180 [compost metagenome]